MNALAILLGEIANGITRDRPTHDRKLDHQFRADAPAKDLPCVFPGCKQKFRKSTQYWHYVAHYEQHHRKTKETHNA